MKFISRILILWFLLVRPFDCLVRLVVIDITKRRAKSGLLVAREKSLFIVIQFQVKR